MIGDQKNEKFLFKIKIFVLIIEIIVVGIIAFIFFGVSKVNAQTNIGADYWAYKDTNGNWPNSYSNGGSAIATTDQINIGWNDNNGSIRGNINGYVTIESVSTTLSDINDIRVEIWTEPTQNTNAVITKSCTLTKNTNTVVLYTLKCQFNFSLSNNTQPYLRVAYKTNNAKLYTPLVVTGYINVEPNNGATTSDIVNQTIQITNEIYQNILNTINAMNNAADKIIDADDERYQAYLQFLEDTNTSRWTEEDEIQEEQTGLLQSILGGINRLFSSSVDDPEDALGELNEDLGDDTPISNLFLLPVSLYQNVINNINGTCNSINLGSLWNHDLIMTCISIPSIIGNTLYGVIDILISGFFILAIRKKFIEIFENLSNLHTRRNELE